MEKNLGHATAYGYAKSKGYSGTEEEFAELMADYASVGQSAAQSAEQAAASATSASGSAATASQAAQTATSKASEAVTAADTATTKASEASTSAGTASTAAQTATDKASEATTAATTATAKASEASESAATATNAKTDAETARDAAAQSASQAAESARTLTIDATLKQSGQAADAKAVGDEIDSLKSALQVKSDVIGSYVGEKTLKEYPGRSYVGAKITSGELRSNEKIIDVDISVGQKYSLLLDCPGGGTGNVAVYEMSDNGTPGSSIGYIKIGIPKTFIASKNAKGISLYAETSLIPVSSKITLTAIVFLQSENSLESKFDTYKEDINGLVKYIDEAAIITTEGEYITQNGQKANNDAYHRSGFIQVENNTRLTVGYSSSNHYLSAVSFWRDEEFTSESHVSHVINVNAGDEVPIPGEAKFVVLSADIAVTMTCTLIQTVKDRITSVESELISSVEPIFSVIEGQYINRNGDKANNDAFHMSGFIDIDGVDNITVGFSSSNQYLSAVSFWRSKAYDSNSRVSYIVGVTSDERIPVPEGAKYLVLSESVTKVLSCRLMKTLEGRVKYLEDHFDPSGGGVSVEWPTAGKKVCTLGDSITAHNNWQQVMQNRLQLSGYQNCGISGTRVSGSNANAFWQDVRVNAIENDCDMIVIMGGTNDAIETATIGDATIDNADTTTFCGALNVLLSKLFYRAGFAGKYGTVTYSGVNRIPLRKIIPIYLATPIRSNGIEADDYANAMKQIGALWGIPVIDVRNNCGLNDRIMSVNYYSGDGIHPTQFAGALIGHYIASGIMANYYAEN